RNIFYTLLLLIRATHTTVLFPYTTLFRSGQRNSFRKRFPELRHPFSRRESRRFQKTDIFGPDKIKYFLAGIVGAGIELAENILLDRKSTRLNSSHVSISYAVFCLKKKKKY